MRLDGRVALVTGAARGIGRAIALALAGAGADVAIGDRQLAPFTGQRYYRVRERRSGDDEAISTVDAVAASGRRAMAVEFDVSDEAGCAAAVERAVTELGQIDVLVNAAGIVNNIAPLHNLTRESWDHELAVNLTGAFTLSRLLAPGMAQRGWGRVVSIASVGALSGMADQAAYAASKAGLLGLTRSLAQAYGRYGVTANAVLPGLIATPLVRSMPAAARDATANRAPARRIGEPEEVAAVVAFLCSPAASYVNGVSLPVDGGLSLGS
jgi:NAD(P)-dependent dehydrogenase (short-subunit alcohol dehydrogenase family)